MAFTHTALLLLSEFLERLTLRSMLKKIWFKKRDSQGLERTMWNPSFPQNPRSSRFTERVLIIVSPSIVDSCKWCWHRPGITQDQEHMRSNPQSQMTGNNSSRDLTVLWQQASAYLLWRDLTITMVICVNLRLEIENAIKNSPSPLSYFPKMGIAD